MRKFSKKQAIVTGAVAAVLVGTGTAAFAYWTSQGTGKGEATTAAAATTLTVEQVGTPKDMFPGDDAQDLVVTVTNPGPNKVQVDGVSVTPTVTQAKDAIGSCDVSDYQINGTQLEVGKSVDLKWQPVELDATKSQDSKNSVQFFDKTRDAFGDAANQDGCKGATLVLSYSAM